MLHSVQRVLLVGNMFEALASSLADEGKCVTVFSELGCPGDLPFQKGAFDCVVLDGVNVDSADLCRLLGASAPSLHDLGALYVFMGPSADGLNACSSLFSTAGLRFYLAWGVSDDGTLSGATLDERPTLGVVMAVRENYDPIRHARSLFKRKRPDWAFEVLRNYPEELIVTPAQHAALAAEKQLCYLAWGRQAGSRERLKRFYLAQREFYRATTLVPHFHQAYICHAEFWRSIGNDNMAARLLRSIQHVAPDAAVARQLAACPPTTADTLPEEDAPLWSGTWRPRLLMLCHEHSDYGFDTLFEGLHRVLGDDHVVEFPWKPSLHGDAPEFARDYPCTFNLPGTPRDVEWVCSALREGLFDAVLYCDTLLQLNQSIVRHIMDAAVNVPLFVLDTWDDGGDYLDEILGHLGRPSVHACFKREMLACGVYSPNTFPLPFSYPDERVARDTRRQRSVPFFWAGKRQDGARSMYLDYVEKRFGFSLGTKLSQAEYARTLDQAAIGLSLFGLGFDTVRYWELPAHGCMLLSERPPIRIPHNFVDGESAVFFGDLPELETKLTFYLDHPEETARIARAGHDHLLHYHTNSMRARQLLGRMEAVLAGIADRARRSDL